MTLIAKPVVKGQFWILTDGKDKVGNVIADSSGYEVKIGDNITYYSNTADIKSQYGVQFESEKKIVHKNPTGIFEKFPTTGRVYNSMIDIKRKLHIFTKSKNSKCYYVAGYFAIKMGEEWETFVCPKYIFVQRYDYFGPFKTMEEASASYQM